MNEDFEAELDREHERSLERVRQCLRDSGREDLVRELDAKLRDVRLGTSQARSTWSALSQLQRRIAVLAASGSVRFVRSGLSAFDAECGSGHAVRAVCGLPTIRNLAARGLLDWDGGAFEPEAAAVPSERVRFVVATARQDGNA